MDKDKLESIEKLPAEDQQRIVNSYENIQLNDSLRMYNELVERCFTNCVDSFQCNTLDKKEESCVCRCAEKFLNHCVRVNWKFREHH